jgi:hypothetical protein
MNPQMTDLLKELGVTEIWENKVEKDGFKQGFNEGYAEECEKIAKTLLLNGYDINLISKTTGLPLEIIRTLSEKT